MSCIISSTVGRPCVPTQSICEVAMCGGGASYSDADKFELENECYLELSAFLEARRKLDESCAMILEKLRLHTSRDLANNWENMITTAVNSSKTMTVGEFESAVSEVRCYSQPKAEQELSSSSFSINEHNFLAPVITCGDLDQSEPVTLGSSAFAASGTLPCDLDEPMTPLCTGVDGDDLPSIDTIENLSNVL